MELITLRIFKKFKWKATKLFKEGAAVSFEAGDGEKGPVAKNIVKVDA